MHSYPYEIDYYITESGGKPFKEWLDELRDVQGRARIRIRLDRARLGNLGDNRAKEYWRDHQRRKGHV